MRRTALASIPALAAGLALAAACSSTSGGSSPSSTASSSTAPAPATSGTTGGPATTARGTGTTSRSTATTGTGGSSAGVSTEGPCGWLTVDEIEQATGQQVDRASVVRGGCRWSDGTTPVVDLEVEAASDGASSFEATGRGSAWLSWLRAPISMARRASWPRTSFHSISEVAYPLG